MMLLTPELRAALRANDEARRAAVMAGLDEPDFVPIAKFFNPMGAATWLASELGEDGDTLFGLADLGFGCPELGSFSLTEIAALRLPLGSASSAIWISRPTCPCRTGRHGRAAPGRSHRRDAAPPQRVGTDELLKPQPSQWGRGEGRRLTRRRVSPHSKPVPPRFKT